MAKAITPPIPTTTRKTAEDVGLVNNMEQKIPSVAAARLDVPTATLRFDIESEKHVPFTHAKCAEYIDLPVFENERTVSDGHVQTLLDHMSAKTFNWTAVTLASCWLGQTRFKINGQHTCWAGAYLDNLDSLGVKVREIVYRVKDKTNLRHLYATYDAGKARSPGHLTQVELGDKPCAKDIPHPLLGKLVAGFRLWHFPDTGERRRITPQQLAALIQRDHGDLFNKVGMFLAGVRKDNKSLVRSPVVAAMFASFDKVHSRSLEFWQPVADGLNLDAKDDPRYRLRHDLERTATKRNTVGSSNVTIVSEEHIFRICIVAWNHWRRGETTRVTLRPTKNRVPLK